MKHLFSIALAALSFGAFAAAGDYVDRSGTITLGGTSQTLAAADQSRGNITIYNLSTESEILCVNVTSAASCSAAGSWHISPGSSITLTTKEAITVVAATTGHKFTAKERVTEGFAAPNGSSSSGGGGGAVAGSVAHDAVGTSTNPVLTGGYASAAAPTNVSADGDAVRDWNLRSGAKVTQPSYGGVLASAGSGVNGTGVARVTIATDDTLVASLATKLDAINASVNAPNAQLPSALGPGAASGALLTTAATVATDVAVTLTRTADTNAYTANDVMGAATGSTAALTFTNLCPVSGGTIMITSASFEHDASALISGESSFVLHLYNVTPPSALGDNAAFDLPSGDRSAYLGSINLGTPVDLGSTLYVATDGINKQIKCAGTNIYGYLVTVGAFTPASAAVHVVTLHAVGL